MKGGTRVLLVIAGFALLVFVFIWSGRVWTAKIQTMQEVIDAQNAEIAQLRGALDSTNFELTRCEEACRAKDGR